MVLYRMSKPINLSVKCNGALLHLNVPYPDLVSTDVHYLCDNFDEKMMGPLYYGLYLHMVVSVSSSI